MVEMVVNQGEVGMLRCGGRRPVAERCSIQRGQVQCYVTRARGPGWTGPSLGECGGGGVGCWARGCVCVAGACVTLGHEAITASVVGACGGGAPVRRHPHGEVVEAGGSGGRGSRLLPPPLRRWDEATVAMVHGAACRGASRV